MTQPAPESQVVGGAPLALKWRLALARSMSVTSETRRAGVSDMLERHRKDQVGYWFQLVLAIGIATFGLVVGSTGVVIGAMLVSPLMGPIVEVGMGLVTGAPLLVIRSASRSVTSIFVVVAGSAALSWTVPIHEVNSKILARTSPTLIDLYVACFCAFAAAYTTVRQSSATVSAAAGTSISIALVPPLCVVGWGLGSGRFAIARGAAMLFTANFAAIVLFAMIRSSCLPTTRSTLVRSRPRAPRRGRSAIGWGRGFVRPSARSTGRSCASECHCSSWRSSSSRCARRFERWLGR